ncbi:MAG: 6-phosphogluconolactonase [Candidatus Paceibacterota bacterium]
MNNMALNIKTIKDIDEVADFVAESINSKLEQGKRVLWFITGGSSIKVQSKVANKIKTDTKGKLVITMTDERYGAPNHIDSNWFQLKELGFEIPNAKIFPFLIGKDMAETAKELREIIKKEINKADYKIGNFGIGIDGHTAGILPHSDAVYSSELVCAYDTPQFDRITITPKVIPLLDEAVVFAIGESKWPILEKLGKEFPLEEDPSQILKKVSLLTIFTDKK